MRSHLSPLDATFLEIEEADDSAQVQIGWAAIFEPVPGGGSPCLETLREQARTRLDDASVLRRRLSEPRVAQMALPIWLPDPDFDVGRMIGRAALPEPGGEEQLTDWLGDHFSSRLDRSRPLWEVTLLEGLEGGRWALVFKVHHCLVDGFSAANLAAALVDAEPHPEEGATTLAEIVASLGEEAERAALTRLRGVVGVGGIDAEIKPYDVAAILWRSGVIASRLPRLRLEAPPPTSLNVPTGPKRQLSALDVSLEALERMGREMGGTANDVVMTAIAGGLRRLFEQRGEDVEQVRAIMPLNLRRASESLALGEEVSSLFVELAVADPDPIRRYRRIAAATSEAWEGAASVADVVGERAELAPPLIQSVIARLAFAPELFNLTIANIPSFPFTLYSLGAPMRRCIPIVPLSSGHALGVAAAGYDGRIYFGLSADRDAVPDLDLVHAGIEETLHDLSRVVA
ncbi:MAG TPA: wax ester/triacylglycerol synthase family O-acyltransferase [Solirubrobacterales bacterium]|nr:wax ester/triacylglycerol synthase family O-acyltransferase [Solirubrobacterales bacterium]